MAKGDKPSASSFLPIDEVASTLKVAPGQVLEWMQKDKLRGNDAGIKPYDLKKFQLDHQEEIRKAQAKALKDGQKSVDKKPAKGGGFFSRIFGGGKSKGDDDYGSVGGGDANLAQENRRLREELNRTRSEGRDDTGSVQLEDKVKFLEGKLAKTGGLEAEVAELRRQLASAGGGSPDPEIERQLDATRRELARTLEIARQSDALQSALQTAEAERDRLAGELSKHAAGGNPTADLSDQLEEARLALHQAEDRLQSLHSEEEAQRNRLQNSLAEREARISSLERELEAARNSTPPPAEPAPGSSRLNEELMALQEINLARFARLRDLYQQAQAKLAQAPVAGESLSEANIIKLQSEFETLRVKHQSLLEARETNVSGHQEFVEQLAAARATTTRLKQENTALKSRLSEADLDGWKARVDELEGRLAQGRASDASLELVETELRTVRKSLQNREAQVQKIAGRLQENERALKKALKESTRLTELLIERENRLRDLSTEYEQEYRDKIDNLDRQVSGLQWKLSLREERIASLESEISELRKSKG